MVSIPNFFNLKDSFLAIGEIASALSNKFNIKNSVLSAGILPHTFCLYPHQESNLDFGIRNPMFCPLNYGDNKQKVGGRPALQDPQSCVLSIKLRGRYKLFHVEQFS